MGINQILRYLKLSKRNENNCHCIHPSCHLNTFVFVSGQSRKPELKPGKMHTVYVTDFHHALSLGCYTVLRTQ